MNKCFAFIRRNRAAIAAGSLVAAANAHATGLDLSSITSAVDFSTVATAVVAVGALIAVVLVAKRGSKMLLGMIGR
jgi:hypothetical protein